MGRYKSYGYGSGYSYGSDSYGYGSYGKSKSKSYSYGSDWDYWGSYGYESQDDDDDLVVREPENYATPSSRDIQAKIDVWKKGATDQIKELARICYFKMIDEKDYFKPEYADFDKLSEDNKAAMETKKELYDQIFDTYIPGFTPLEQAIAIYKQMQKEAKYQEADDKGEDSDVLKPCTLDFDREVYTDPNINDQLELNEHSKTRKMSVLDKVSIIGDLGTQFKVEKEIDEKIVSNSDIYSKKMMRDYAQIAQVDLYQKLFPNFPVKLLTKDLVVNVPVDRKEQKQKIIIIIDFSGSMCDNFKQDWVNAIMIDRLKYVLKGEAEVFFSFFVHKPEDMHFQHIHDRETVMKFWQSFSNEPSGGTTQVGKMVERIAADIAEGRLLNLDIDLSQEKPEILVINDGQDDINTKAFPYKVNAICLDEQNNQLKDLCIETKGKQVFVDSKDHVIAYSETGEEIIA
jgi:hypothetical protein